MFRIFSLLCGRMRQKRAIVSVSNDLFNDRRVDNSCRELVEQGYRVLLVGRKHAGSPSLQERPYKTYRMFMLFRRKVFFYAAFNYRLFFLLLFRPADLLLANDLDTLWPVYWVSRIRRLALIYDSHEYFTGMPELLSRPRVRRVWQKIEQKIFPRLKHVITVNESIASLYREQYGNKLHVVRNVPALRPLPAPGRDELGLPSGIPLILLQGAWINMDRGGEEAVEAMRYVDHAMLLIIGGGDAIPRLKEMATDPALKGKVRFIPRQPFDELLKYTVCADIGLSLDKDTNVNYRFSLPNKLFDYIHAGVPVLASDLPEIRSIIDQYGVGRITESHRPEQLAKMIREMLENASELQVMKAACLKAREELCWDRERLQLKAVIDAAG